MIFRLVFKTPDVTDQIPVISHNMQKLIDKYVKYDEYIYVEFDTDKQSVTILEQ